MNRLEALRALGLDEDATDEDIKTAYRETAQILHPDRFATNKKLQDRATEQFKNLQEAYDFLTSSKGRRKAGGSSASARSARAPYDDVDARLAGIAAARTQLVRQRDAVYDERRNGLGMAAIGGLVALFCGRRPFGLFGVVAAIAGTAAIWGIVQVVSSQRSINTLTEHIDELNREERKIAQESEEEEHTRMKQEGLRNVAIIAHVDHGKTTLVDRLLWSSHVFRENQEVQERVLDSNDQERERGITILSKNISIHYKGIKINVIDTPGHADFGGEVERVLNMADGALLIVDAYEGPKPQTRFVLSHALERGLRIVVVVNKIDRPNADPEGAVDKVFDLMVELGASDEQLDFPVVYASAVNGYARLEPDDGNMDMIPLLDTIINEIPCPDVDAEGPVALQVCTVDHSSYEGRIGVGRLHSGTLHEKEQVLVVQPDGNQYNATIRKVYTFENLGKTEVPEAHAGDIVAVIGVEAADIGDVITDPENPVEMEPIAVEEPTMAVVFEASTSPLVGREGDIVGARQLKERLMREKESNISMRIDETEDKSGVRVAGRGVLHLSVLMETMRREGFEFQVGRPQVVYKTDEHGNKLEPIEEATVDVPNDYSGKAIEVMGTAGGIMEDMFSDESMTHLTFSIPSRGTMGLKTRILNATHGEAVLFHHFREYGPYSGEMDGRKNGCMIAMATDKAVAYALDTLQQRGRLFVKPGDECYEGMIVGESAKEGDMVVNVSKTKNLGNQRSSTADKAIQLTPPITFTLEEALEYIEDDELVEVTPESIRLRKRILSTIERKKANKK